MSNFMEKSLVIRKETVYDKIRRSLFSLIFKKDYEMMQKLDELMLPKRPDKKIIIPNEIGKNIYKF